MKIDVTQTLNGLNGQPIGSDSVPRQALATVLAEHEGDPAAAVAALVDAVANPEPLTLRVALTNALVAQFDDEQKLPGEEKVARWTLAQRVHRDNAVELSAEEVSLAKKLIGRAYGAIVVGPAHALLDPPGE